MDNLENLKNEIKIPEGIDLAIKKGIEKGKKDKKFKKHQKTYTKIVVAAAILVAVTSIGIVHPDIVKAIPGIQSIPKLIKHGNMGENAPNEIKIQNDNKVYSGTDEVNKNIAFKLKYPKNIDDLKLKLTKLDKHTYKGKPIDVADLIYEGDNNKQLVIQEVNTDEETKLPTDSVTIVNLEDGTKATVIGDTNNIKAFIQINFHKDNMNITVGGQGLGEKRLLEIANDLNE